MPWRWRYVQYDMLMIDNMLMCTSRLRQQPEWLLQRSLLHEQRPGDLSLLSLVRLGASVAMEFEGGWEKVDDLLVGSEIIIVVATESDLVPKMQSKKTIALSWTSIYNMDALIIIRSLL